MYEDNNNTSTEEEEEEDEINIRKEDKDLFINVDKPNKSKGDKMKDKKNSINVNRNSVINNKKLIPEDNNKDSNKKYTKTSYGFFNTYKNTIITPYSNYVNKNKNKKMKKNYN